MRGKRERSNTEGCGDVCSKDKFKLLENKTRDWYKLKHSIDEDPGVQRILRRVDTCLQVTNMSYHFNAKGLDIAAKRHAKDFYKTVRTVIPKSFSADIPCWETSYKVALHEGGKMALALDNFTAEFNSGEYHEALKLSLQEDYRGQFSSSVVCLPNVFLSGFPKCGSTYLYDMITKGLGIPVAQAEKEPHMWVSENSPAYSHELMPKHIAMYLLNFAKAASWIGQSTTNKGLTSIDATPNMMHSWPRYYGQESVVNYCLEPAIIPEVLPESKYIVIMRNPVETVYSAFWYSCTELDIAIPYEIQLQAPTIFHNRIDAKLNQFNKCLKHFSLEWCVVNITYHLYSPLLPCGKASLGMAIYYVHLQKWLSVVPRDNFIFLLLEEVLQKPDEVGRKLWQFMKLPGTYQGLVPFEADTNEQTTIKYHRDPHLQMRTDTKQRLKEFFQPYNEMLADLLGDDKFLWQD